MKRAVLVLAWSALLCPCLHAAERWRVFVGDVEITSDAAPRTSGKDILIHFTRCAPHFRLQVRTDGREVVLNDTAGQEWRGRDGGMELLSGGGQIALSSRLQIDGTSLYLPVDAIAVITGTTAIVDTAQRLVRFEANARPSQTSAPAIAEAVPEGWSGFFLPKTDKQKAESTNTAAPFEARRAKGPQTAPPKATDLFRVDVAQGYLLGHDFGTEASASGLFYGYALSGNTLVTGE
jgi:hypothetical protein